MQNLKGKNVVLVGATGDIGGELAITLRSAGAHIIGVGRNLKKLQILERQGIHSKRVDCSNATQVLNLLQATFDEIGEPDALITSVGTWREVSVNSDLTDFDSQLNTDLVSIIRAAVIPLFIFNQYFRNRGSGLLVDISSWAAERILPGNLTYALAKAAVKTFIENMRNENGVESKVLISRAVAQLVDTPANRVNPKCKDLTEEDWKGAVQISDMATWIAKLIINPKVEPEKRFQSKIVL